MKKYKNYLVILVAIIGAAIYISQSVFNIDLVALVIPDTEKPIIDTDSLRASVSLDGVYLTSDVTCEDNKDVTCEVEILGSIDTSVLGSQTITINATDAAGNKTTVTITVEVIEGLDTQMYVPLGYYVGIESLTGESLKSMLNDIITGHTELPYTNTSTDVWDMLREADEDPDNSDNVLMFYSGFSWPKDCQDTTTPPDYCVKMIEDEEKQLEWNREHIWSKSHGDFEDEDKYEFEDSSGGYALGAHTDGHHLVAVERRMNSTKNNRFFDDCHDGVNDDNVKDIGYGNYTCGEWFFEPRDEVKGDVARMLFYMATRYEGEDGDFVDLELTSDFRTLEDIEINIKNSKIPYYADLDILLKWHIEDPVDEWELERNEVIYQYQNNRNPFIDMPELVELIWGTESNPINYISID